MVAWTEITRRQYRRDGVAYESDLRDRNGTPLVAEKIRPLFPWLRRLIADGRFAGEKLQKVLARMGDWTLDIVKRPDRA